MPQLVALFNGVGGAAAALVAMLELPDAGDGFPLWVSLFTVLVGAVSFSGSAITFAKLQELMTTRPVIFRGGPVVSAAVLAATLAFAGVSIADVGRHARLPRSPALLALGVGVLLVLPVGGADVPIVISPAQRVHRPDRRRPAATCSTTPCCSSPAPWSAPAARS